MILTNMFKILSAGVVSGWVESKTVVVISEQSKQQVGCINICIIKELGCASTKQATHLQC